MVITFVFSVVSKIDEAQTSFRFVLFVFMDTETACGSVSVGIKIVFALEPSL